MEEMTKWYRGWKSRLFKSTPNATKDTVESINSWPPPVSEKPQISNMGTAKRRRWSRRLKLPSDFDLPRDEEMQIMDEVEKENVHILVERKGSP
jgi:hypothetical protein